MKIEGLRDKGLLSSANIIQIADVVSRAALILAVLATFLANSSPICLLTTKTTQPCPKVFSVNASIIWQFAARLTSFSHIANFFQNWSTIAGYDELCV